MWKFMWDDAVSQPLYVHCDLCLGKLKGLYIKDLCYVLLHMHNAVLQ